MPPVSCGCSSHGSFLTVKGLKEAEQRRAGPSEILRVDMGQLSLHFDSTVSVSGLRRDETLCDYLLDEQYRRFHNGS